MRKLYFLLISFVCISKIQSQLLTVGPSGYTILSGTTFSVGGLTLVPSADYTIINNTLDKYTTVTNGPTAPNIARVYRFTNSTNSYSGSVQINYNDGAELNGIDENRLSLLIYNPTNWYMWAAATRNATNNFVLTNPVILSNTNEITLAAYWPPLAPVRGVYYEDKDGDGYGNPAVSFTWAVPCDNCSTGWVTNNLDCDDTNFNVKPGSGCPIIL